MSVSARQSMYQVFGNAMPASDHMLRLGYACHIMSGFKSHQLKTVTYGRTVIRPALRNDQIRFYFDAEGSPVGYVVWAYLADDTVARIRRTGEVDLHASEFAEGKQLWIVDFLVAPGRFRHALADLLTAVFPSTQECWYFRHEKDRLRVRHLRRTATGKQLALSKD